MFLVPKSYQIILKVANAMPKFYSFNTEIMLRIPLIGFAAESLKNECLGMSPSTHSIDAICASSSACSKVSHAAMNPFA